MCGSVRLCMCTYVYVCVCEYIYIYIYKEIKKGRMLVESSHTIIHRHT
jgi:hypothetical protein